VLACGHDRPPFGDPVCEDGPTRRHLCSRAYYWDHGATWLNETTIALGGIGDDDFDMIEGARIFDLAVTGPGAPPGRDREVREVLTFPGPAGTFFSAGGALFSADSSGLSRWDPKTGARTGHLPGFRPAWHHRGAGELAAIVNRTLVRWKCDPG
jgi:hypothetical protein